MEQVLSHRYSAEGEGTKGGETRGPVSGIILAVCIPLFMAIMVWAAITQPEVFLPSLMWGQVSL